MRQHVIKLTIRITTIAIGGIFVAVGIAGLFLPFLPGFIFLLVGLVVLSRALSHAKKFEIYLRRQHPHIESIMVRVNVWENKYLPTFLKETL